MCVTDFPGQKFCPKNRGKSQKLCPKKIFVCHRISGPEMVCRNFAEMAVMLCKQLVNSRAEMRPFAWRHVGSLELYNYISGKIPGKLPSHCSRLVSVYKSVLRIRTFLVAPPNFS